LRPRSGVNCKRVLGAGFVSPLRGNVPLDF
jgi:hypothetical protein